MIRLTLFLAALLAVPASFGQKGETPPYDPAPPTDLMSVYANKALAFTVFYPKEFVPGTPQDLQTVMNRGHRLEFGTDPKSDPEHQEALRCMHTLLYATAPPAAQNGASPEPESTSKPSSDGGSSDTILVEDFDSSCVPKKLKGDKALTELVGSVLHLPNAMQLVPQIWFVAGGNRRIHSGMAGTMLSLPQSSTQKAPNAPSPRVPMFILAAGVEQKEHRILIVYLSGTSSSKHVNVPHMSIAFEDGKPVLLFPFLLGKTNLVK